MEILPLPEFHGDSPIEIIGNIYKDLGWGEQNLNPTKVKISEDDWLRLYTCVTARETNVDSVVAAGLFLVNYGPSGDRTLTKGSICLEDGWLTK